MGDSECKFSLLTEPVDLSLDDVESSALEVFLARAIVNPFGPTLVFVAAVGEGGLARPLVEVSLNPFTQQIQQIGSYRVGDTWQPVNDLEPLYSRSHGACPSILLLHAGLTDEDRHEIGRRILDRLPDAKTEMANIRAFFGDPWSRVAAAMPGGKVVAPSIRPELRDWTWMELIEDPEHFWPELAAFLYAWSGSIEKTGLPAGMRASALKRERLEPLLHRVLASCWLPPRSEVAQDTADSGMVQSSEVRTNLLDEANWRDLPVDSLLGLLQESMLTYARRPERSLVAPLRRLYRRVVESTDREARQRALNSVIDVAEREQLAPTAVLPAVVCEPEETVAGAAAIAFVMLSDLSEGNVPETFAEIEKLLARSVCTNPGAVFGAVVALGDARFESTLERWRKFLKAPAVQVAARINTGVVTDAAVRFWLGWAESLAAESDDQSQDVFGSVASALALLARNNKSKRVVDIRRRLPCTAKGDAVEVLQEWTVQQYAEIVAPRFYALEAGEEPPRVFSTVIELWGLPASRTGSQVTGWERWFS